MTAASPSQFSRDELTRLLAELRPRLHRYCARMTGSVIDGEDAVQDALAKAVEAFAQMESIDNPEGWLFRIAHNAALDLLRRRARDPASSSGKETSTVAKAASTAEERVAVAAALRSFMHLPLGQRSSVILMDVLGYSLDEIAAITGSTVLSIKASLHRGRTRLRELAAEPDDAPPLTLSASERALLIRYVDRFNAHDFDAVRAMLAAEVRLDLVAKTTMKGKAEVQTYFHNYSGHSDWHLVPGFVEGRPAVLVCDRALPSSRPLYFVLLTWTDGALSFVRDFRYARYAVEGSEMTRLDPV
jgi:RNA polymerase sigma-70 factor (ECF subfamily)